MNKLTTILLGALMASTTVPSLMAQTGNASPPPPETAGPVRRMPDGKPDLSGFYSANAGGANYGLEQHARDFLMPATRGVVVDPPDRMLPYKPWARAEFNDRMLPHRGYDDPTAHCFVAVGVPRPIYVPSPTQILQTPEYLLVLHERMAWRAIPIDSGRQHLPDTIRLWMGDSLGRWEGDKLVVESRNFNGKGWLNERGDILSHAQTVVEEFIPVDANKFTYRATITDPIVYTRPYTIQMDINRSDDEILEVACHEDNGDLHHMRDVRDEWRAANPGWLERRPKPE